MTQQAVRNTGGFIVNLIGFKHGFKNNVDHLSRADSSRQIRDKTEDKTRASLKEQL